MPAENPLKYLLAYVYTQDFHKDKGLILSLNENELIERVEREICMLRRAAITIK